MPSTCDVTSDETCTVCTILFHSPLLATGMIETGRPACAEQKTHKFKFFKLPKTSVIDTIILPHTNKHIIKFGIRNSTNWPKE